MKLLIPHPFLCSCCLLTILFFDSTGILRCCMAAAVLHELGHALAYRLLLRQKPVIRLHAGGLALQWAASMATTWAEVCILAAGPAVNFLAASVYLSLAGHTARFFYWFFGGVNLLMGVFNLLPIGFLDGGRLLELLLLRCLPVGTVWKLTNLLQWLCLTGLCLLIFAENADQTTRLALVCFMGYFCFKSFCVKN